VTTRPTAPILGGLAALLVGGLLAGCSSDDSPASDGGPRATSATASPTGPTTGSPAEPAFNPCDGVDAAAVSQALGSELTKQTGTAEAPRCALLPEQEGGPTFELSYLWFDQGLEAAWSSMKVPAGKVSSPRIPGADDARLVVNESGSAYAVSAFLQNGDLIQTVNAFVLSPYDGSGLLRATNVLLRQLSAARG
jgi:hypothetical protein